ncbi:MAG: bifunctional nuclease family protein [Planctomycetes bacterium]|nr:bifunctional nuclease family protein [Planctomycetota bacterium]
MMVPMQLSRIFIREMADMQIIELTEVDGERSFPIVIGLPEAFAIERRLKGMEIPRPQTHDLLAGVIESLGGALRRIEIHDMREGTFFAALVIDQGGREVRVDSRPSDAIALGVAQGVPILVAEAVLEQAVADAASGAGGVPDIGPEQEPDDEDDDA